MLIASTIAVRTDSLEVFPRYHAIPFSKMLTFYRTGPFTLDASYNCSEISQDKSCLGKLLYKELVMPRVGYKFMNIDTFLSNVRHNT